MSFHSAVMAFYSELDKERLEREVELLFEEATRREEQLGMKAYKNAMVMLKWYLKTGKSNFHQNS